MAFTSREIALQMLAQLRILDPSVSAEVGTPERLLLDTVASQVADSEIDITALAGGFDIDAKFGRSLEKFLAIFNFGRQGAVPARGFVTFSRNSPALRDIRIPGGTQVVAPLDTGDIFFRTTFDTTIDLGGTSASAPIEALVAGDSGNVAATSISELVGNIVEGVTAVTNETPTSGGLDSETDDAFKIRFKNTIFRNVSGTTDQYLALAISTPFSSKANVVGPISRYREYIQVPSTDDLADSGGGNADEWTTAMSTIPYSKHIYDTVPFFVSNGLLGAEAFFYREATDFILNTDTEDKDRGDTKRLFAAAPTDSSLDPDADENIYQPNVTFLNVLLATAALNIQGVRPDDVVLFEHSYMSSASRNDYERNVTNAVDVFVDGGNLVLADTVIPLPTTASMFVNDPVHPYYDENYRRSGEPEHRAVVGNLFTPLFFQPVLALPDSVTLDTTVYYLGHHYWLVEDVSDLSGTVRARNGIEWNKYLHGQANGEDPDDPTDWTGAYIHLNAATSVEINSYSYDKNINDLQTTTVAAKQTTTDPLVHRATTRYFKLDITCMFAPGANVAVSGAAIRTAVQTFLSGQYFGTTIQLSDLLQVVHNTPDVDNVRWSRDVNGALNDVVECDVDSDPLLNLVIDQVVLGTGAAIENLRMYFTGSPTSGSVVLSDDLGGTTYSAAYNVSAGTLQTQLRTLTGNGTLTVTGSGTPTAPFLLSHISVGTRDLLAVVSSTLSGGPTIHNADFYLQDDELPSLPTTAGALDTVAGLIIRPKAQNTWGEG